VSKKTAFGKRGRIRRKDLKSSPDPLREKNRAMEKRGISARP